jgi:LmbE family N-acetylglucosaminyl deacetylase
MPLAFVELREEGLEPHRVREIFVAATADPDTWIDITDTIDLKIEALRQHASQFPGGWDPGEMIREWAAESGAQVNLTYAETFKRIVLVREDSH